MKKNFLAIALISTMSLSSIAALANDNKDITLIKAPDAVTVDENSEVNSTFTFDVITVSEVTESQIIGKNEQGADFLITIADDVLIYDAKGDAKKISDIKKGNVITAFDYANAPRTTSYPISFVPNVVVINGEDEKSSFIMDTFETSKTLGEFANLSNSFAINIGEDTQIIDVDGKKVDKKNIDGSEILVFCDFATFSLPAQTNPTKVIILKTDLSKKKIDKIVVDDKILKSNAVVVDGIDMLPLREIAESVGFNVSWNEKDGSISFGPGYAMTIDENSYIIGKAAPVKLEVAPTIVNEKTYVPVSYFEQILGASISLDGTTINIALNK